MRFITHGDRNNKALMLIHGMGNTSDLFDPVLKYLPQLEVRVFDNMGHGQLLHQHPEEYARFILDFLK